MLGFPDKIPFDAIEVLTPMLRGTMPPKKLGLQAAWNLAGFCTGAVTPDDAPPSSFMLHRGKMIPAKVADVLDGLADRCKKAGGRTATGRWKGAIGDLFKDIPWLQIAEFLYQWAGIMLAKARE